VISVLLECPSCGSVWEYAEAEDREFVSAYCLCRTTDPRGAHHPVRMREIMRLNPEAATMDFPMPEVIT